MVYLKNQSSTKAVSGMTPYEAWMKEKPVVDHLQVFGCVAYAHIPRDKRRKLDPKAKKSIFVGYGKKSKGYRLFDPESGKIILSRNVVFNEEECRESETYQWSQHMMNLYHHLNQSFVDLHDQDTGPITMGGRQTLQKVKGKSHTQWKQH